MKYKINVLFLIMQMGMGGSERLVYNLIRRLDKNKFNAFLGWFNGEALKEFADLNIPLFHFKKNKRFDFRTMRNIEKVLKEYDIDIVNAQHFMPSVYSFYGCLINKKTKHIPTFHSEWEIESISPEWKVFGRYMMKFSNAVVGISSKVDICLQREFHLKPEKVVDIWNGVDINPLANAKSRAELKKYLEIHDDLKIIGMVGNFRKIKNHIFLLQAFKELLHENSNVLLILVGQGFKEDSENSEPDILSFIKNNNLEKSVLRLGYRPDVDELLQIMDIFCLTSYKEGLPISIIEAMAAGLPAVGTDVDGIRDVIINGKTGSLVPLGDVNELKSTLLLLLQNEDLRASLGKEARKMAERYYSLDECIRHYQNLFISATKRY